MIAPSPPPPPPKQRLSLGIVLGASLALNAGLAGYVAINQLRAALVGRILPVELLQAPVPARVDLIFRTLLLGVSANDMAVLRSAIAAHGRDLITAQRNFDTALAAVRIELRRNPVDPAALRARIDDAVTARTAIAPAAKSILDEALPNLSPNARERIARFRERH